ncbi:undecaprenyl-diphosphatase [Conyzicola lurida]|uniref:Undecaprenyl-diphosphatase n=1 Tax=Conyzicola lurida TaxID=1172621 RepID=A0A841AP70_9MICO|nr:phosphatase PAP2 family protein [Conyzicola lurida]MBB5843496.1 undecaprenyl-diphosphatase [Conyzicola lurida]
MRPVSSRLVHAISASVVLAVPAAGAVLSVVVGPPVIDLWWRAVMVASRTDPLTQLAYVLDVWGADGLGFGVIPALIAGTLLLTRRARAVPGFLVAGVVSLVLVQALKPILARARPDDMLTISDAGSFPSGHVTNVATLGVFAALIYRRLWVWVLAVGYILVMAWSRTYLSAHWLSDTIAGALWGSALAVVVYSARSAIARGHARRRMLKVSEKPELILGAEAAEHLQRPTGIGGRDE